MTTTPTATISTDIAELGGVTGTRGNALREALERIARWHGEFPETGKTWPDGTPTSYSAEYGSNGEREYMRQVAINALAAPVAPEPAAAQDMLEAARAACIAEAVDMNGDYRDACHTCAQAIQTLKWDAQPLAEVSAAQAVPELLGYVGVESAKHLDDYRAEELNNSIRLYIFPDKERGITKAVYSIEPTDTTREA